VKGLLAYGVDYHMKHLNHRGSVEQSDAGVELVVEVNYVPRLDDKV
jgi:hypothetical protein